MSKGLASLGLALALALALAVPALAGGRSAVEERMRSWGASRALCAAPGFAEFALPADFYCLELEAPVPSTGSAQTTLRFAVHPAEGPVADRRGVLVTLVGGPGEVGLEDAPGYLDGLSGTVRGAFDLVWFNQRGVDPGHGVQCPAAQRAFTPVRRAFPLPIDTPAKFDAMAGAVRAYTAACAEEIANQRLLPFLATDRSVADVERFRERTGEPRLFLYGQSYGTQFGQTYVHAHPGSTERIVLDGVVDLTLTGMQYFARQVPAFDQVLVATLKWCAQDPACQADFAGQDPLAFYDGLAAELARGPATVSFPVPLEDPPPAPREPPVPPPSQHFQPRQLRLTDLEFLAYGQVYSPAQRADLLRWLAAAASGDRVPLLRAAYAQWPLDPATEAPLGDANDAPYYAVECLDFAYSADPRPFFELEKKFLAAGTRLASAAFIDLPCAFWPGATRKQTRPGPFAPQLPVLLLNGTLDPATPVADVREMIGFLGEWGDKVELGDAGHVILDMGDPCVVPQADAFLAAKAPLPATWDCQTAAVSGYLPLARPRESMQAIVHVFDLEISSLPEYRGWEREDGDTLVVGCTRGGTASFTYAECDGSTTETWSLDQCSFFEGATLTAWGRLRHDADDDSDVLELTAWDTQPLERRHYLRQGAFDLGELPDPGAVSWQEDD